MQRVLRQPENPALPESGGEHYDGSAGFSEGASWCVKKRVVALLRDVHSRRLLIALYLDIAPAPAQHRCTAQLQWEVRYTVIKFTTSQILEFNRLWITS